MATYRCMPFGKYRDTLLVDLPLSYLEWALRTFADDPDFEPRYPGLLRALTVEVDRRFAPPPPRDPPRSAPTGTPPSAWPRHTSPVVALRLLRAGKRALAQQVHPDVGGATADMQEVNDTAAFLETWLLSLVGRP